MELELGPFLSNTHQKLGVYTTSIQLSANNTDFTLLPTIYSILNLSDVCLPAFR